MTPDAFLIYEGALYRPKTPVLLDSFLTPVCALIEGIWSHSPKNARAILRSRIFANYELTPSCEGMVKLAAKRVSAIKPAEYSERLGQQLTKFSEVWVSPTEAVRFADPKILGLMPSSTEIWTLINSLRREVFSQSERHDSARSVSAILTDPAGKILSYAWNENAFIKVQHAEHQLLRSFVLREKRRIPMGCALYVSLKPCCMCAGEILQLSEDIATLSIIYQEDDPGPKASNSALILGSDLWIKAGRPKINLQPLVCDP